MLSILLTLPIIPDNVRIKFLNYIINNKMAKK
jgi:hypothetical protein